jgi:hypothetical protein
MDGDYEGTTVEMKQQRSEIEVYVPENKISDLESALYSWERPSWWQQARAVVQYGRMIQRDY